RRRLEVEVELGLAAVLAVGRLRRPPRGRAAVRDLVADQLAGVEVVDRVAALGARDRAGEPARRRDDIDVIELAFDHRYPAELLLQLDLGADRRQPRDAQAEAPRELERAGVRALHREQLLQVRLGA